MSDFTDRLTRVRLERFGECGAPLLAGELGLPLKTWLNYEAGVIIPGPVLLALIDRVRINPHWLLTGEGEPYLALERVAQGSF